MFERMYDIFGLDALNEEEIDEEVEDKDMLPWENLQINHLITFYYQIYEQKRPAGTQYLQCFECIKYVSEKSYQSMVKAGRTNCPICDGSLKEKGMENFMN